MISYIITLDMWHIIVADICCGFLWNCLDFDNLFGNVWQWTIAIWEICHHIYDMVCNLSTMNVKKGVLLLKWTINSHSLHTLLLNCCACHISTCTSTLLFSINWIELNWRLPHPAIKLILHIKNESWCFNMNCKFGLKNNDRYPDNIPWHATLFL